MKFKDLIVNSVFTTINGSKKFIKINEFEATEVAMPFTVPVPKDCLVIKK